MESLKGYFLISTTHMPDPRFQEQVIYLCAHTEEGAMGLVINNPNPMITLHDVLRGADIPVADAPFPPVYMGGPVEMDAGFILFSSGSLSSRALDIAANISLSRDIPASSGYFTGQGAGTLPLHARLCGLGDGAAGNGTDGQQLAYRTR